MVFSAVMQAQKITITGFYLAQTDQDARVSYPVTDPDGDLCALIKVQKNIRGLGADVGMKGVSRIEDNHPGETWIYVPQGIRHIKLLHNDGNSDEYQIPVAVEKGNVYIMDISQSGGGGRYIQEADETGKFVEFFVTPANATLEFDNDLVQIEQGHAEKFKEFGRYQWRASAPNYHTDAGYVTIDRSSSENQRVRINLKPAFGFLVLEAADNMKGALVFIDDVRSGTLPFKSNEVKSGRHTLRVALNMYKTYEQTITIEDGQTLTLKPELQPNFAETTLEVDADAEIWVNGQKKGVRKWSGPLEIGNYKVECRQANHETVSQNISISSNKESKTFTLNAPIPIYGGLRITSSPSQADVFIDGDKVGTTPFYSAKLLIGKHQVSIRKEGYGNAANEIEVTKGVTTDHEFKLTNIVEVVVTSTPDSARVFIDGTFRGHTPFRSDIGAGQHSVRVDKDGFYYQSRDVTLDGSNSTLHFTLAKNTSTVVVRTNPGNGWVTVDGKAGQRAPASYELSHGTHKFVATRWGHYRGEKSLRVDAGVSSVLVNMTRDMIQPNSFYVDLMYKHASKLSGYGANLGFFAGNFNVEGSFYMPLKKDDHEFSWYPTGGASDNYYVPMTTNFKPKFEFGGKMGYGIKAGKRMRLTPQIGARYLMVSDDGSAKISGVGTLYGVGSLRISVALATGIALTVVPEYAMPITESDGFKFMKDYVEDMKKWNSGFNCFGGITFFL